MRVDLVNLLGSGGNSTSAEPARGMARRRTSRSQLPCATPAAASCGSTSAASGIRPACVRRRRGPAERRAPAGARAAQQPGARARDAVDTADRRHRRTATVVADAMRKFVPRQQSPALLLANLAWIAQRKGGVETHAALPSSKPQRSCGMRCPQADTLGDASALETAIARSGVFLEANLAAHRGPVDPRFASDLKTLMLALRSQRCRRHGARPSSTHSDAAGACARSDGTRTAHRPARRAGDVRHARRAARSSSTSWRAKPMARSRG